MRSLLPLFFLLALISNVSLASDWDLRLDKDGIKVYTRDSADSNFKEFKGVTEIQTSLNSLVAIMEDTDACKRWVYKCLVETTLRNISPSEKVNYSVSDGSPLDNRDAIVHIVRVQDPQTKTVTFHRTGEPGLIPEKKNIVRVQKINGEWILKPTGNGRVMVIYETASDPGGNVPSWLANTAVTDTPYYTLLRLRSEVMNTKYQGIHDLVVEP